MAPDMKAQKRKAAQASARPTKKVKKSTSTSARKPPKKIPDEALMVSGALPAEESGEDAPTPAPTRKSSRKRATDFFDEKGQPEPDAPKTKKAKKSTNPSKPALVPAEDLPTAEEEVVVAENAEPESKLVKANASKKAKPNGKTAVPEEAVAEDLDSSDAVDFSSEEGEDQTAALLKGFESSDEGDVSHDEGFEPGRPVPALPQQKQLQEKLKGLQTSNRQEPGVVYVGRIPHGFYESEMREYFSQFGEISRLRLSRNPKSGASKHYAFIEFRSGEVAEIAAATMDNYLMFGHILKCQVVPKERLHPELWKGANRRFKKVPWSKIEGKKLAMAKPREVWEKKVKKEQSKRAHLAKKLQALGYEFDVPRLRAVEEVPRREEPKLIEGAETTEEIADGNTTVSKTTASVDDIVQESTTTAEKDAPNGIVVNEEITITKGKKDAKGKDGSKTKQERKKSRRAE